MTSHRATASGRPFWSVLRQVWGTIVCHPTVWGRLSASIVRNALRAYQHGRVRDYHRFARNTTTSALGLSPCPHVVILEI